MQKMMLIICIVFYACTENDQSKTPVEEKQIVKSSPLTLIRKEFRNRIDSVLPLVKAYTKKKGYNDQYFFLADLNLHSGFDRFAVIDLNNDSIKHTGLVAHGVGGKYWSAKAVFSNTPNSLCSSPGKYRIGVKYNGRFGKAYKLHGLDKTNSKAFERFIVLHAYDCVPDKMPYPGFLCNSEGCPMVSYKFLDVLSIYIDKSKKPVLLWILG